MTDPRADLLRYLRRGWEALPWKLEGLSEYAVRRPMTPTGTNLLGLVKHVALTTGEYFGEVVGRPFPMPPVPDEPNADMWAGPDESREAVLGLYVEAVTHAEAVLAELGPDAPARVPWWPEPDVTLHRIMAHMVAELHRHCGHADILRELLDGAAGMTAQVPNLPEGDAAWWTEYRARVQAAADSFRG